MLRKENTVHISLYKHIVRFLSLPINNELSALSQAQHWEKVLNGSAPKAAIYPPNNHGRGSSSSTGFHFTAGLESQLYKGIIQS